MCTAIQALWAMPAVSNKITLLWQHWNLMRDEQMNICTDNVVFLDTVSRNPTPASTQSPLTPKRFFYYESSFHISVTLSFTYNIWTKLWFFTTSGHILCIVDRVSRHNSCKWPTWRTILFSYMFIPSIYMFRATMCSSSGELNVSIQHLVYVTRCRWPSGV
jgi:hypothetical protein